MKSIIISLLSIIFIVAVVSGSHLRDWQKVEAADLGERLTFFVALKQQNINLLEELVYSVSDPKSPEYGRSASEQEIADLIYPPKEHHDIVYNFFSRPNVHVTSYGDSLKISAPVSEVADIFSAEFHWYQHLPSGHSAVRAAQISIPSSISAYVEMVTNLVSLPIIIKKQKSVELSDPKVVTDANYGYFAPSTLRRLYNIPAGQQATHPKSSQCAIEFTPEGAFSVPDLQMYCKLSDEKFYNYTHILGPFVDGEWGNSESELDVQLMATVGSGADNWFWTIQDGWIYEMAVQIYNNQTKPWVFSISYGWPEQLTCGSAVVQAGCGDGDNAQYIARANAELAKLGAIRISVIVCSQDEGAPSSANIGCQNETHPIFGIYPGSSPFATCVSATTAVNASAEYEFDFSSVDPPICNQYGCSNSSVEYACMVNNTDYQWTTGGGFSEFTTAPSYQKTAVAGYFSNKAITKPPTKYTWPTNRGYPDLSAIGARVLIVSGLEVSVEEGTSASTPIIAGMITLLNDDRFHSNKAPLGFLNPMLYQMAAEKPATFKDITVGNNVCTQGGTCCEYGYYAGTGWDPVTGLGTPNFGEMLEYVHALP